MREHGVPVAMRESSVWSWDFLHSSDFPFCVTWCVFQSGHADRTVKVKLPPFHAVVLNLTGMFVKKPRCHGPPPDPVSGHLHRQCLGVCMRMYTRIISVTAAWTENRGRCLSKEAPERESWHHREHKGFGLRHVQVWMSSVLTNSYIPGRKPSLAHLQFPHLYSRDKSTSPY